MLDYKSAIENSKAKGIIQKDIDNARLSHAYLFLSPDDDYLKCFCEYVCKLLINQNKAEVANNNIKIEKKCHPDVKYFGEEKAIDTKTVAEIVEAADYSPFEADKKLFVIFNAGDMNEASQNKILKTIEEPPKNTFFILAAKTKSKILQTILSRVKEIKLEPLESNVIATLLESRGVSKENAEIFASCSNGNATFAERISLDNNFVAFYKNIVSMFVSLNGSKDVLKFSVIFTDKKVDKAEFFDISTMILRDALLVRSKNQNLIINKSIMSALVQISAMLNESAILELIEKCTSCKKMLMFNVSGTSVVDEFLFKLAEEKVKCRRL